MQSVSSTRHLWFLTLRLSQRGSATLWYCRSWTACYSIQHPVARSSYPRHARTNQPSMKQSTYPTRTAPTHIAPSTRGCALPLHRCICLDVLCQMSQRAFNRWHLALLLLRNPSLIKSRRHFRPPDQEDGVAALVTPEAVLEQAMQKIKRLEIALHEARTKIL